MKHRLILLVVAAITCSFMVNPFAYYFITVNPATGKDGIKPEKTIAVYQKPKGKATEADYKISGAKSAVRLKIADAVFSAYPDQSSGTLDPSLYISLFKLSPGKTNRILSMNSEGGGSMWVPVNFSTPDGYTIRIKPSVAMQPGEYALVDRTTTAADGNVTVWTFGID